MPFPSPVRTGRLAAALVGGLLLVTGCSGLTGSTGEAGSAPSTSASPSTSTVSQAPAPAVLKILPADASTDVEPTQYVSVAASSGRVEKVTVTDDKGAQLEGVADSNGTWTSTRRLRPAATYTISVEAKGEDGTPSTTTSSFSTIKPKVIATYGINYSGSTVGVGMPVAVQFDSAVTTPEFRAEVERNVSVTTTPKTEGAWGWLDNRQLMWRPKSYWKPGTVVKVEADLRGVQTGPDKWVGADASGGFTIGDSRISTVDMAAHKMTVTLNGKVQRVIPVSTGRPGPETETRTGTKVIIEREGAIVMDSATVGIPKGSAGYYRIPTKWNLRVTWTGEFLHSAPWSVGSQGVANVSHGCTNMAPAQAEWMFNFSRAGDVVNFIHGDRPMQPTDGIGVWVYSFDQWKKQSALA